MAEFCDSCKYVMRYEVSQSTFRLTCSGACGATKVPASAVIFSSEDDDKFAPNVTKVHGDLTVQRWNEKCPTCNEFYYLYFEGENKDVLYICKCSLDKEISMQGGSQRMHHGMTQSEIREEFASEFATASDQMSAMYDFLPILK